MPYAAAYPRVALNWLTAVFVFRLWVCGVDASSSTLSYDTDGTQTCGVGGVADQCHEYDYVQFIPNLKFGLLCQGLKACADLNIIVNTGCTLNEDGIRCADGHQACDNTNLRVHNSDLTQDGGAPNRLRRLTCKGTHILLCNRMKITLDSSKLAVYCEADQCDDMNVFLKGDSHLLVDSSSIFLIDHPLVIHLLGPLAGFSNPGNVQHITVYPYNHTSTPTPTNTATTNAPMTSTTMPTVTTTTTTMGPMATATNLTDDNLEFSTTTDDSTDSSHSSSRLIWVLTHVMPAIGLLLVCCVCVVLCLYVGAKRRKQRSKVRAGNAPERHSKRTRGIGKKHIRKPAVVFAEYVYVNEIKSVEMSADDLDSTEPADFDDEEDDVLDSEAQMTEAQELHLEQVAIELLESSSSS